MNKKRKKIIAMIILFFVFVGIFFAYKMANKSHIDITKTSAEIIINASVLIDEFSNDEILANNKYLDKIIQVNGKILSNNNIEGKGVIELETSNDFGSVLCHFSPKSSNKIRLFEIGKNIEIKGICTGFLMDVVLVKCEIINQ